MGGTGIFIAMVFILVGSGLTAVGIVQVFRALAVRAWVETGGQITTSEIVVNIQSDFMNIYSGLIVYEYLANGALFSGSDIRRGIANTGSYRMVKKRIAPYPENSLVKVHYNPQNPAQSVLEKKISADTFIPLVIGILTSGFTIFIVIIVRLANV